MTKTPVAMLGIDLGKNSCSLAGLGEEAEEVVVDGPPGRQWHTSEILAMVVERGSPFSSAADKYVIDIALQQARGLERLGRLVWAATDASPGSEVARIDIRQAIIALLQQAGRPLRSRYIRQRLLAIRGVNDHFQIAETDPLIRVSPGVWGLNDRDIPVKRADQPALMDSVVQLLRRRDMALHASELASAPIDLSGLSSTSLLSLASADARLRVNGAHDLYLAEWSGPRREGVSEAVRGILKAADAPVRFEDLVSGVSARIRRECDRGAVSACLQALEARLDRGTGRWSLLTEVANDADFEESSADIALAVS